MAGPFDDLIPAGGGTAVADAPAPASDNPFADLIPKANSGGGNNPFADLIPRAPTQSAQYDTATDKFTDPAVQNRFAELSRRKFSASATPLTPDEDKELRGMSAKVPTGLAGTMLDPANATLGDPALAARVAIGNVPSGFAGANLNLGAIPSHLLSTVVDNLNTALGSDEDANKDPEILKLRAQGDSPVVTLPKPTSDTPLASATRGVENAAERLSTPANLQLLAPLGVAPKVVQKAVGLGFGAMMATHGTETAITGLQEPTTSGKFEKVAEGISEAALGFFGLKEGLGGRARPSTSELRPTSLPEWVKQQTGVEINQENPSPASIDGLLAAKEAAGEGYFQDTPERQQIRKQAIDEVDKQLAGMPPEAVKAVEEERAKRQSQPIAPVEGEAPPVTPGGPPIQGGRSSLFTRAKEEAGAPPEVTTTPESETPTEPSKIEDPAMHQAALDSAERIATQVTQGQGDIVQRAARDAAYDKIKKNMEGGHPTMSFVRQAAEEAAGKTVKAQPSSLDAETETGKTVGESVPSEALTPVQEAAKADMLDAVQKQVEALPADIQKTAKAFLNAAQNDESTSLRDLGEKLGVSQTTVANHLKKMQQHFTGLKEEGYSVGPGAASISEQIRNSLEPTSLKRAVVDTERLSRGAEPIPTPERQAEAKVVSDAEDRLYNDPTRAKALVARIVDEGDKSISEHDAAELLVERRRVMNERNDWETRLGKGEDVVAAKTRLTEIENELDRLDSAQRAAGTQWGRLGHMYQRMIRDDFTLEGMERKARAAKEGPLTEKERAKIKTQSEEIEKRQAELDKAAQEHADAQLDADTHAAYESAVKDAKEPVDANGQKIDSRIIGIAEKIVRGLENQADSALKRIRARRAEGRVNSLPVDDLIDYSIYGAAKIARKGLDFAKWSAEMVKDIGPMSKEVLDEVWKASNKRLDDLSKKTGKDAEKVKSAIKKKAAQTPVEAKAAAKAEAVAGEPLSHQTVYNYVRALIQSGVHGVDPLMKAAHEGLKEHFPDLTERDVRRAFSEYGKAKFPSKDAVKVELAETRRITQLQESIDRLKEGQDPLKSGLQRDKATQQIREKQRELNELLKKHAGPPSPEKLASRDQAKQTALRNAIEDLDKELRTGEKTPKGEPVPDSAAVEQLKAERDAMKAKLKEIQDAANPPKSPEEKYNDQRLKQIQKRTAELEARLEEMKRTGVVPPKPIPEVKKTFASVAKADADLTAKKREVNDTIRKIAYDNRSTPQQIREGVVHALKLVTSVKVLGHGTVGMFTHAGGLAWRPTVANIFWRNFGRQFKLWTSKAYHDQAIYRLKNDPDFETWKNAGASIDPERTYTDYGLYAKWLGKLGEAGGRGFDALKLTRLELNKAAWDKVPSSIKNDPLAAAETRKAIADINNKATGAIPRVSPVTPEGSPNRITNGVYNLAKNPLADAVFFAPKLYASRWARVVLDPVKTVATLADWKSASAADKTAAKIRMKNAGQFAAVYLGALLINKGLLKESGSNQDVNIDDPTKPDWLKFKGAGKEITADGGLLDPIRLLGQVVVGDLINARTRNQQYREGTRFQKVTEDLAKYARSKFNPTLGLAVDATTGTDYAGKPLPWSKEPPKFHAQGKYTWGEWLLQQGPIPMSQGVKVAYDEMRKNGISHIQTMEILKGAASAALGFTGVHATEDYPKRK